jgi:hypothetical protein
MVMKAMLIGLLVIGAVAMLETDANAWFHCARYGCLEISIRELEKTVPDKELENVVAAVKKYEGSEVWLIGFTRQPHLPGKGGKSKEFDRVEHQMEDVRQTLIQRGLPSGIFRSLILEGYAPQDPKRRGIKVIVAWPLYGQDKR